MFDIHCRADRVCLFSSCRLRPQPIVIGLRAYLSLGAEVGVKHA